MNNNCKCEDCIHKEVCYDREVCNDIEEQIKESQKEIKTIQNDADDS